MWLLLVFACAPWSDVDLDGDGFGARDCDDGDPRVHPGAPDPVGDGTDGNCDGLDGVDGDGDGFASTRSGGEDCDDALPEVHPGAAEVCNQRDDDCDGTVDREAEDALSWYRDHDADGVGGDDGEALCEAPEEGWSLATGDCDDSDAAVAPGLLEPCGLDLDCDGVSAACESLAGPIGPDVVWTGPAAASGAGFAVAAAGDVDGDGWPDAVVGAPELGMAWILDGPFVGDGQLDDRAIKTLSGTGADRAGSAVASLGDVNDDGLDDLLIGAEGDDVGGIDAGGAWLLHGSPAGGGTFSTTALQLIGEEPGDQAGHAVAGPGDADGDGVPDLLIGAPGHGPGGAAYLFGGGLGANTGLGAAALELQGPAGAGLGWAVGGGDVDGDGLGDLVLGGPMEGGGAVWLVRGSAAGVPQNTVSLAEADAALIGTADGDQLGWSIAVGDVDGDGREDLWIGAPGYDGGRGAAWLVLGNSAPAGGPVDVAQAAVGGVLGVEPGERVGLAVSLVPDLDGDGRMELALGGAGTGSGLQASGGLWVVTAPLSGTVDVDSAAAWRFGDRTQDALGAALGAGDWNLDGRGDLLIGAPGAGTDGMGPGQVWLKYGG